MKTLYLESIAGIAGDMFAAAVVDARIVSEGDLAEVPRLLGLTGVDVRLTDRTSAGMRAKHLVVLGPEGPDQHVMLGSTEGHEHGEPPHWGRSFQDLDELFATSRLDATAKQFARRVLKLLAEAEAEAHGIAVNNVHFHEIGAVDSAVDIAMAGLCVSRIGADRVLATPVKLGRGVIQIQHGTHAVPPPASAWLVEGMEIDSVPSEIKASNVELSTPTGLAILRALHPTFVRGWPGGTVLSQGTGCGTMDLDAMPNTFRVVLLESSSGPQRPCSDFSHDSVIEICCNIDDESAERLAWTVGVLRERGALDVWMTGIVGKKGRPATQVSLLVPEEKWSDFAVWILRHTSTFGLRYRRWSRMKLSRAIEEGKVSGQSVRMKVGTTLNGRRVKEKPEYEDVRRVWEDSGEA